MRLKYEEMDDKSSL